MMSIRILIYPIIGKLKSLLYVCSLNNSKKEYRTSNYFYGLGLVTQSRWCYFTNSL